MAENRDSITSLDLGIESTGVAGNLQAAEAFLAGDDTAIVADPDKIEEIKDEPVPAKPKPDAKKTDTPVKKDVKADKVEEADGDALLDTLKDDDEEEGSDKVDKGKEVVDKQVVKKDEEVDKDKEDGFNDFGALAKDLFKIGVFTPTEGEEDVEKIKIENQEDLKARFEKEGQIKATQWLDGFLSRFGDAQRELFEAIFIDGVSPSDYLPVHNEMQSFEGIDITNEKNQEKVFKEYYTRIGWTPEAIDKKLQKTKDYGDLEDESKEIHPQLIAQDKERAQQLRDEKTENLALQTRIDQEYKVSIAKILDEKAKTRDFDGIPINDKKKNQAFDFLYTKKYKTADGQLLTDFDKFIIDTRKPENHALRVKIALLALDGFDLTKVEKRAVSKESNSLFNELAQKKIKKTNTNNQQQQSSQKVTSWFAQ